MLDGFGHMGNNAHWFSNVIDTALLSAGTTELFFGCTSAVKPNEGAGGSSQ
jgi:hypothetical protein